MRHALFGTLPGRAIVIGLAVKLLITLVSFTVGDVSSVFGVVDTAAGFAVAIGVGYFLFRLFALARRRLLWRVRRKLILSYIFIGFVPAILIVVFFMLGGLLLFFNFGSSLVQAELRGQQERARFLATGAAREIQRSGERDVVGILTRWQTSIEPEYQSVSLALVPVPRPCSGNSGGSDAPPAGIFAPPTTAGPWTHVDPPRTLPGWIRCEGFSGLLAYSHAPASGEEAHLFVRAVAFPDSPIPGYAVVADVPLTEQARRRLQRNTGVELIHIAPLEIAGGDTAKPLAGRPGADTVTVLPAAPGLLSWVTFLEYRDWNTGQVGTLVAATQQSIAGVYNQIANAQGSIGNRSLGRALLLALLFVVGGLFLVIEAVALIAGFALARSITGSVHELFTGTERIRRGDFTHRITVNAKDQLGELAGSFNSMTASIEDLLVQAAEKKRLEEELRIAHEIQMSLLPQAPLVMPGLSITAVCVPAREVGGDYYDFLPLDERRVGVLIADVSGKGTSAALYMAELKGLVLSLSRIYMSPRELLINANRIIAEHLDARSFITMIYAVVDLQSRTMTYARAGHTPLICVPGPGAVSREARIHTPDGLVLGLKIDNGEMFERLLEEETLPLHPGDLYLFFTDGISEAMNASDDCFGERRLASLVERHADLRSDELRERVLREVEAFVGDAPQHDDMTMILLKVDADVRPQSDRAQDVVMSLASGAAETRR